MKHRNILRSTLAVGASWACIGASLAAGQAEVKFIEPAKFSDIGWQSMDRERHLQALEAHVKAIAQALPEGQLLKLEFTDIDLAGEQRPLWRRHVWDVRVVSGRADWPQMSLRYTLSAADGRTLDSGEERISDLAYTMRSLRLSERGEELAYDKRLLSEWFTQRFATKKN
jgi:hypothetical protein